MKACNHKTDSDSEHERPHTPELLQMAYILALDTQQRRADGALRRKSEQQTDLTENHFFCEKCTKISRNIESRCC